MVFDPMYFARERGTGERGGELFLDRQPLHLIAGAVQNETDVGAAEECIPDFSEKVSTWVGVDRDVCDIGECRAGLLEAIAHRLGRKSCPMFDATKALFVRRGDEDPVAHHAGG